MRISLTIVTTALALGAIQQAAPLPAGPLAFGAFNAQFREDGTFRLAGEGWPTFAGKWKVEGQRVELTQDAPLEDCGAPGRYDFTASGGQVTFHVADDTCMPRRMILDRSTWRPAADRPARPARRLALETASPLLPLPRGGRRAGELALVPRSTGIRRRGRPAPARSLGRRDGREHPVAHADSRVSRIRARSSGAISIFVTSAISRTRTRRSSQDCTAMAMRRRIVRASAG